MSAISQSREGIYEEKKNDLLRKQVIVRHVKALKSHLTTTSTENDPQTGVRPTRVPGFCCSYNIGGARINIIFFVRIERIIENQIIIYHPSIYIA